MNGPHGKKDEGKFTIQFSRTDPAHIKATGILNSKERRGKAQYIANAILYYESYGGAPDTKSSVPFDEKSIEAVVNRILLNRVAGNIGIMPEADSSGQNKQPQPDKDIVLNDDIKALGADGLNAIAGAMEMFKMKQ